MGSAGSAAVTAGRRRLAIRRQLATTPGRLRLAGALIAAGAIVFGVAGAHAASTREAAVRDVQRTEPLLVAAVDLSASLSDAHALAASSFLVGGPEPATSTALYRRSLRDAAGGVTRLAAEPGTAAVAQRITEQLPAYSGLIENARAYRRQGYPVGSAYLRRASVERDAILAQGRELYRIQATSLTRGYRAATDGSTLALTLLAGLALLGLLVATQVYLARTTHRIINPGLAAATVLLLGVTAWIVVADVAQQRQLRSAQRSGSDPIELLTATRILALRGQSNESVGLAARVGGGGEPNLTKIDTAFAAVTRPIGVARAGAALGSRGLLDAAAAVVEHSPPAKAAVDEIYRAYRTYIEAHRRVVAQERVGAFTKAIKLAAAPPAVGAAATDERECRVQDPAPSSGAAATALNCLLVREVEASRARFDDATAAAGSALGGLAFGIPALTALAALLALLGVRLRLEEYR